MPAHTTRLVLVGAAVVVALATVFAAGAAAAGRGSRTVTTLPAATAATVGTTTTGTGSASGIAVDGTGQAPGTPDVLRLDLGVSTTGSTASQALDRSSSAMAKVVAALRDGGVQKEDIRTSGLSLDPTYDYAGNRPRITGYTASNSVTASLRDLGKAGRVIQQAVAAGGDAARLQGVTLDLDHDDAVVAKARQAAFADAKAKAQAYAAAAGRELGAVVLVSESTSQAQPVDMRAAFATAAAGAPSPSVPVSTGATQVGVTVHVVWSFA